MLNERLRNTGWRITLLPDLVGEIRTFCRYLLCGLFGYQRFIDFGPSRWKHTQRIVYLRITRGEPNTLFKAWDLTADPDGGSRDLRCRIHNSGALCRGAGRRR